MSEDDEADEDGVLDATVDIRSFMPLHLCASWEEPVTTLQRVSMAIILPSGVEPQKVTVRVIEVGKQIELTVQWPQWLVRVDRMHRKWLTKEDKKLEHYHPEILGFEKALKEHRARMGENVISIAKLPLPFPVESHILEKHFVKYRDGGQECMVYLRLRQAVDEYAISNEQHAFEEV